MRLLAIASFALASAVTSLLAQSPFPVGTHDVAWSNLGAGSPLLFARVSYPAMVAGADAAPVPRAEGWPTIVFLHGYSQLGSDYTHLTKAWAAEGFVVVALDTAQWSWGELHLDAVAAPDAIEAANAKVGWLLTGMFDTSRLALVGHSMGGGVAALALSSDAGYRAGFVLAPAFPGFATLATVHLPVGVVVGEGDAITPWQVHAWPFFYGLAPAEGLKAHYLLDTSCDHMSIAGLGSAAATPDMRTAASLASGFLRHFLTDDVSALEASLGPATVSLPGIVEFRHRVALPQAWMAGPARIGQQVRFSLAAESGFAGLFASVGFGAGVSTPFGTLLLDPTTVMSLADGQAQREFRADFVVDVPNDPYLVGLPVAIQGIGATASGALLLGSAFQFTIQP
jgi:hypothetical protein